MMLYLKAFVFLLSAVTAYDIFEGFMKLDKPCFRLTTNIGCNTTLVDSFKPQNPLAGPNEPTTAAFLFTSTSPDMAEPLHLCGGKLPPDSTYDPEVDTEIFIHGWLDGVCRTGWPREMKEQLFLRGKYNVILVDWTWGNTPDYAAAGENCKIVGEQVGFIIHNIMQQTGCSPKRIHLIGHSFGAIASGYATKTLKRLQKNPCLRIRRITGLDPAYAPFGNAPPEERLTYRDAKIVDIIHSNSYQCVSLGIGDERQLGHADFYPNGGKFQASCYPDILNALLKGDLLYGLASLEPRICSHLQSIQYYKVSINPKEREFIGLASKSYENFQNRKLGTVNITQWAVMGMNYEKYRTKRDKKRRKYYLNTNLECPYYDDSYLEGQTLPSKISCSS